MSPEHSKNPDRTSGNVWITVPTLNEVENLDALVYRIRAAERGSPRALQQDADLGTLDGIRRSPDVLCRFWNTLK